MPTITEKLEASLRAGLDNNPVVGLFAMLGFWLVRTNNLPPSLGYEELLIAHGVDPIPARGIAHTAVKHGNRRARDSQWTKPAADAIRFMAKPGRHLDSILARAKLILDISEHTTAIETIFTDNGFDEFEFLKLIRAVLAGDHSGLNHISEIAALVSRNMTIRRGPKISAASAAHEFIMAETKGKLQLGAYTYDDIVCDFTDPLTIATRREFNDFQFNPKPARRRVKARNR